jgi:hypothetical protein
MRFVIVLMLVAGCFGDDDGDGSNYVAIDQMDAAYKEAICTYYARCGLFPDAATCIGANVPMAAVDANLVAAIHAGRVIYNGGAVKACFNAIAAATCDETDQNGRARPRGCEYFVQGTAAGGEPCIIDEECISQECTGGVVGMTCQAGTCLGDTPPATEPAEIGMPCTSLGGCVVGAYCDPSDRCAELKDSGVLCNTDDECGYGLGCTGSTGTRTCETLPAKGEACPAGVCRDFGNYCAPASGTCQQVGLPGSPCNQQGAQCSPYYTCDTGNGTCKQGGAVGEPCSSQARCFSAGTYCDSAAAFTCAPTRANGATCTQDIQCESDNCDPGTTMCTGPLVCMF